MNPNKFSVSDGGKNKGRGFIFRRSPLKNRYRRVAGARHRSSLKLSALVFTLIVFIFAAALLFVPLPRTVSAASPASGAISPVGPVLPFTGTWTGTATGTGSANGESTCVEGVNCDTFRLTVAAGDYTGKIIPVKITWTVPANDYDLYVHKCPTPASTIAQCNATAAVGQDGQGAPQTEENASIDPNSTGIGDYTIHVVYFATSGPTDQYHGSVSIAQKNASRAANYVPGGITFSPNVTVKAPATGRDGEPSSRTDKLGNFYVAGIRGFPAGVDLWYVDLQPGSPSYDPFMRNYIYRGQPDAFSPTDAADLGGDGGGDVDLAVSMPDPVTSVLPSPPTLASSSLIAANISTQKSIDKGQTFTRNNLGNVTGGVPADDRQWEEFHGPNTVYLLYRTLAPAVTQIQRSTDGGLTFGPAQTAGQIGQVGYIDVHQATGTVYISGSTGQVCHSTVTLPNGEAAVYVCTQAATDPNGVAHIFFPVKVADDGTPNGTVYVAYSNDHDIFLVHSTDRGVTWSQPVRVNNGPETKTSVFPWLETGPTPGSVGIVWYGTSNAANDDNANWNVFYAQTFNATAATPTFRQTQISDHAIHGSNISEGGLTGTANRNLIDYFQISFDPTGAAVVGYTDDHNDFDGHTYVARQISGPTISGDGKTVVPSPGAPPPASSGPLPLASVVGGQPGAQVTDFRQDVTQGLVAVVPADDPLDILSIKYSCDTAPSGELAIAATMKLSNLSVVPPGANWRMNFTANAPGAGLSPTGDYSFALSDRGDQFFLRAATDASGAQTFVYGTAVRNSDGSLTYTVKGNADCGAFDTANNTITVKVAVSKLNALVTKGPAIITGSVLAGLRGQAFTTGANAKNDLTRGGTEFTVGSCASVSSINCNNVTPPTISIGDVTVTEGNSGTTNATFNVILSAPSALQVAVNYATADGTATAGSDYQATSGTLTFAPGETSKTITVLVNGDTTVEPDETFFVNLSNPTNATIAKGQGIGVINNDDAPPPPSLTINDVTVTEGNSGTTDATFTATLSSSSNQTVTVQYATADGTATAGSDYQASSGTLTFAPGQTSKTITVLVNGDTSIESDETFSVNLSNATNATIADAQGIGTISNDDVAPPAPTVQLSAATYTVAEDAGHFTITVTRINTASAATVNYGTSDPSGLAECATVSGNASQRCDYTQVFGKLSFAAGESSKTVTVPVIDDVYAEGQEGFFFTLSNPGGATLGTRSTATLIITDNDSNSSAPNPINGTDFFVLQHYLDFLNREPDPGGFKGWRDTLNNCASGDTRCDRIEVSSSFFRSPEFQERGYFVYRFYSSSLGRKPNYEEFMPDLSRVSGFLTEQEKEDNKAAFVEEFMSRQEFKNKYDSQTTATGYVDTLLQAAGLPNHPSRAGWIDGLNKGTLTRAKVLRELAESTEVQQKFFNEAFVVMQYFGYLRRNPDKLYLDWIKTMNDSGGNYRIMVNGFLNSQEYRSRFGKP